MRKWKEKVAWPRLTKEDIKVSMEGVVYCCALSVHPGSRVISGMVFAFPVTIEDSVLCI